MFINFHRRVTHTYWQPQYKTGMTLYNVIIIVHDTNKSYKTAKILEGNKRGKSQGSDYYNKKKNLYIEARSSLISATDGMVSEGYVLASNCAKLSYLSRNSFCRNIRLTRYNFKPLVTDI